ncbi:hypothetical protein CAP31_11050 [Sulfuriferula sp. AH1]|uniref:DUF2782 domain-containing protein n=1 Tax=Sulfuriferula sp. AH1 TaxID=1985873 RepID=UPI000B3B1F62|nr:DUF2782 domain-containing protein [Sulfuriferula sp. AH1]ARU32938.1 hypothetical protein CAP31_11050 [Sulfuriferula sp. AH1]
MRKLIAALVLSLPLFSAAADRPADLQALPEAPPPPGVAPDDSEPQITIKHRGEAKIEEYSVHGRVYMIKVTPSKGKPYYLVDSRGDGQFSRQDNLDSGTRPPMWVIHSW